MFSLPKYCLKSSYLQLKKGMINMKDIHPGGNRERPLKLVDNFKRIL